MLRTPTLGAVALVLALGVGWWVMQGSTAPAANQVSGLPLGGCDPLPVPPPLPTVLTPSAPTVEAVVQALDAALTDAHKVFLRCFPDEDVRVARVHFGLGRWLRNTLHLFSDNPLTTSLRAAGVSHADQMSSVILRAYARSLHGQPLDIPGAVARARLSIEAPET